LLAGDDAGDDPLHRTHFDLAELLVLNGAALGWQDAARGYSALHLACALDSAAVAKYLIDKGADPLAVASCGRRPLDLLAPHQSAAKAVVEPATLRAEERVRQDNAPRSPDQPRKRDSIETNGSKHAGSSVVAAARRFTQALNPSAAMGAIGSRLSVSSERPTLKELYSGSDHPRVLARHDAPAPAPAPALADRPSKRLLPNGFRDLNGKISGAPALPPILSAREPPATPPTPNTAMQPPPTSSTSSSRRSSTGGSSSRVSRSATVSMPRKLMQVGAEALSSRRNSNAHSNLAMDLSPARAYNMAHLTGTVSAVSSPTTARFSDPKSPCSASTTESFVDLDGCVSVGPSHPLARAGDRKNRPRGRWILRTSSSADVLKPQPSTLPPNVPPVPDGVPVLDNGARSRFRLLPKSSRLPFNGLFGRSVNGDKKHA
ncbi:hypothetical protein GGI22_002364, partial [Coemansia erecta]